MMNNSISRYIVTLLRHRPEQINLTMDKQGWVLVDELLEKLKTHDNLEITIPEIQYMVKVNSKKRFALKLEDDKFYIRANQGHSIRSLEMDYKPVVPPDVLYHGTGQKSVKSILASGIVSRSRQYVHLSNDVETAINVGVRHGKPRIFFVNTKQMHEDGIKFYCSENGVWLTEFVDAKYLELMEET